MGKRSLRIGLAVLLLLMLGLFVRPVTARAADKLDKPANLRYEIVQDAEGITCYDIFWDEVKGAKAYELRYAEGWTKGMPKSEFTTWKKVKVIEVPIPITKSGVMKFQVRAWRKENGKKVYSKWATIKAVAPSEFPVDGGWTVNDEVLETNVTEEQKALFEEALNGLVGVSYTPVDLIAEQAVNGMNYMYLCTSKVVYPGAGTFWKIVTVNQSSDGKASMVDIADLDLTAIQTTEAVEALAGGWYAAPGKALALPKDAQTAFDQAMQKQVGVNYEPIALLGSQVVAGMNYRVLCRGTVVTQDAIPNIYVMTIYADPLGNAVVGGIQLVDLGAYCNIK